LVKKHHPDANGGSRTAEEKLKSINQAFAILEKAYHKTE
jgi:curved DNA-binding protein CbpA